MRLLPPYDKLITGEPSGEAKPKTLPFLASTMTDAESVYKLMSTKDITAVGLAIDFDFGLPPVSLSNGSLWCDIRSIHPAFMALAVVPARHDGGDPMTAIIDLRIGGIARSIERILRLRVPFIVHGLKDAIHALWTLGIDPDISQVVDTQIVALCLNLGYFHPRAAHASAATILSKQISTESRLDELRRHAVSLVGQCAQYDFGYPYSETTEERRHRRLTGNVHESDASRRHAVLADAEYTAQLYLAQQPDILRNGLFHHLYTVEIPFAVANARMEWRGVQVDEDRCHRLRTAARQATSFYATALAREGVADPDDACQVLALMQRKGLISNSSRQSVAYNQDQLIEDFAADHPAFAALREYRKASSLVSNELLAGLFRGADGRVHPRHVQMGAATGRNTCVAPNVVGIGRRFRPIVTAPPRRALLELDYGQFEIGIAAAEHDDTDLIAAYNDGDIYVAMAKRFFNVGHGLDAAAFKELHGDRRDAMKTIVLAVIYNIQPRSLARKLRVSVSTAAAERARFLDTFPSLKEGLERSRRDGLARGHATTITGLRRRIEYPIGDRAWTKNFLSNTPIQGSATVVFKRAVVALDAEFRGTNTWLVLPIHDAILIECDLDMIDDVAQRSIAIMKLAMRSVYHCLEPRIDINRVDPTCWNKDGRTSDFFTYVDQHAALTPASEVAR